MPRLFPPLLYDQTQRPRLCTERRPRLHATLSRYVHCLYLYCTTKLNDRGFVQNADHGYTLPCPGTYTVYTFTVRPNSTTGALYKTPTTATHYPVQVGTLFPPLLYDQTQRPGLCTERRPRLHATLSRYVHC